MTTIITRRRPEQPPKEIVGKPACAQGHLWRPETTRYRFRNRNDRIEHGWSGWERDCLICRNKKKGDE